jgi:adenine phosphoribosyltransferase
MHEDAVKEGWHVMIHDDLLATGGTATAAGTLVNNCGASVVGFSFLIELTFLPGRDSLKRKFGVDPYSLISY